MLKSNTKYTLAMLTLLLLHIASVFGLWILGTEPYGLIKYYSIILLYSVMIFSVFVLVPSFFLKRILYTSIKYDAHL